MNKENNMRITIMTRRGPGFTLIELMITLAIAGILLAIAVPSYRTIVLNNRMSAQSNELLSAFQLARNEAVKRNGTVTVCKSANAATCSGGGAWTQGWIVFTDVDGSGTINGADAPIQVREALTGGSSTSGSVLNFISYVSNGATSLALGTTEVISLCPVAPAGVAGRDIQITASGRARVQNPPAAACP